ncbi:glycosyltransferase family 2 protein [Sulfuriferula sp.]|uniref:glycosyltransferase family 2 protein n=1 Tax=Sulfuriferula sp. TaxID=2025307 RepID=UPI002731EB69|nr:glycosyltransferase family 2 protein [Sulfuriferula sp.]MDP2025284.1 glycosyltransferase family 2 protein [Sulfuriferula sp.]
MNTEDKPITLSVVVPAYNELEVLPEFHRRLSAVLDGLGVTSEVVYANDGSCDGTLALLEQLAAADPRVAIVDLSRNFGKEIALTAGMDHARGEAVVVIDADLQDPPELIPELVKYWREGFDVVYAKRTVRDGESWVKKATAKLFYQVIRGMSRVDIPQDVGDFRLLSRRAVDALGSLREQHRFMKGLFAWIGFPSKAVLYKRDPRFAGETKWNYWKLWNFALEGITSFTIAPLKIATYVGMLASLGAFVYAAWIIYRTLMHGDPARGYPSMMVVILFFGGLQLMGMGIIGEYLGRMFDETKNRPLYFLKGYKPSRPTNPESKT